MLSAALQFATLLFTALVMVPAMAHLMEMPRKIRLSREDYLVAQQLYRGWALAGILVVAALACCVALAIVMRDRPLASTAAAMGAVAIVATQVVFWRWIFPANRATHNWTRLPGEWPELRRQWEYGHAACALLGAIALVSVITSVVSVAAAGGR
jgi:ABC-type Fe3+-siderophore transport system permease subunit